MIVMSRRLVLAALLAVLPAAGFGQYTSPELAIHYYPAPAPAAADGPSPAMTADPADAADGYTKPRRRHNGSAGFKATDTDIDSYLQAISTLEKKEGAYASDLVQPLLGLGSRYRTTGQYALALEAYDRAGHISRVNKGLFTQEQVKIVSDRVDLLQALGRFDDAGDELNHLVELHKKLYGHDDVRVAVALDRLAAWQFEAYRRSLAGYQGQYRAMTDSLAAESGPFRALRDTQDTWLAAIRLLVEQGAFDDPRLQGMEDRLLETYLAHSRLSGSATAGADTPGNRHNGFTSVMTKQEARPADGNFDNGLNVFKRKVFYLKQRQEITPRDYVDTLVALGDWYLIYDHAGDALARYEQAYAIMADAADAADAADPDGLSAMFSPAVPVQLPAFGARAGEAPPDGVGQLGWIDLRFTLDKHGRPGNVKAVNHSDNTDGDVVATLQRLVRQTRFRPQFADGHVIRKVPVALRYYYELNDGLAVPVRAVAQAGG